MNLEKVDLKEYTYILEDKYIAKYPLENRENSKLLVYDNKEIKYQIFSEITQYIDSDWTIFLNNTQVVPARLFFKKDTGALIEIIPLHPISPYPEIEKMMAAKSPVTWECTIGNLKKWQENQELNMQITQGSCNIYVKATLVNKKNKQVKIEWDNSWSFAELLEHIGEIPLPPYMKREALESDIDNYQTVYAQKKGAIAAPTAGLHFTESLLSKLKEKGIKLEYLTLHVGAGTFLPIKEKEDITKHPMHKEEIVITKKNLETLLLAKKILAVGTTSLRTLESIYWIGIKLIKEGLSEPLNIEKLFPYKFENQNLPNIKNSITALLKYMEEKNLNHIISNTSLFILPGYKFRACNALVTNFHQPESTLLLLIAAFIGKDWEKVYTQAKANNYRFLSYGDGSLLFRE